MKTFLSELSRRNVFRVAAAYVIVGWIVLQVVSVLMPTLRLPDWMPAVVFTFLLIGFPIAILLTWAFEMTPEGVRKTEAAEGSAAGPSRTDMGLIAIGVLVVGVGLLAPPRGPGAEDVMEIPETAALNESAGPLSFTLAVLPFENFSDDKQLGWIADGISEDLLTQLASYPRLGIAGRNTSFGYKGKSPDLREVGKSLGVRFVLEGSLRQQGEALRVTAQLIDTTTGNHIWAGQYNPALTEIATLHDTVIDAVAVEVASTILTREFDRLAEVPLDQLSGIDANHVANKYFVEGDLARALEYAEILKDRGYPPGIAAPILAYTRFMVPYYERQTEIETEARKDWQLFLDTGPDGAWKDAVLGLAAHYLGDHDTAIFHAERSYVLGPDYVGSLLVLGIVETHRGNYRRANTLAADCVASVTRIDSFVGMCHQVAAETLLAQERYAEAATAARLGMHSRKDAFAMIILAASQIALDDLDGARETMADYRTTTWRHDREGLVAMLEHQYADKDHRAFILDAAETAGLNEGSE